MPELHAFTVTRAGASAALAPFGPPPVWNDRARCARPDVDPELFFAPEGERVHVPRVNAAKAVCGACPVRAECLSYAVDTKQRDGIWGGKTEAERLPLIVFTSRNGATR